MPDMPLFAFILLGILLFAFAGLGFFFFLFDHRDRYYRYEDDELIYGDVFRCEWSRTGGSENEDTVLCLTYNGGDKAEMYYRHRPANGTETIEKTYTISADSVRKLRELYREHCIPVLADCDRREEQALDAPTTAAVFSSATKSYTITDEMEFPEKSRGVLQELKVLLASFLLSFKDRTANAELPAADTSANKSEPEASFADASTDRPEPEVSADDTPEKSRPSDVPADSHKSDDRLSVKKSPGKRVGR